MNNKNQIKYETHFVTISDFLSVTELNNLKQRHVYNTCDAKLTTKCSHNVEVGYSKV